MHLLIYFSVSLSFSDVTVMLINFAPSKLSHSGGFIDRNKCIRRRCLQCVVPRNSRRIDHILTFGVLCVFALFQS